MDIIIIEKQDKELNLISKKLKHLKLSNGKKIKLF